MNAATSLQQPDGFKYRRLPPVFRIVPGKKKKEEDISIGIKNEKKQIPQFYTEPIFKARKHDFL
jgi:hypothetical protein